MSGHVAERAEGQYLVTVIVPVHNVEKYLKRCVESLVAQTIAGNLEIILVENGSTDNSPTICRECERDYPDVKLLVNDVCGLSEARNLGLKHAKGLYVGFVDSDDFVTADMYELMLRPLLADEADTSYCDFKIVDIDEAVPEASEGVGQKCNTVILSGSQAAYDILADKATASSCVRLFHRSFFEHRQFPEGQVHEDHAVMYKWLADCACVAHVEKGCYFYCLRSGSITRSGCPFPTKKDLLNAQLGRYRFVAEDDRFTAKQKRKLKMTAVKGAVGALKSYVYFHGLNAGEYHHIMQLRQLLLDGTTKVGIGDVGIGTWLRLMKIRYRWNSYFKHLVSKIK